nr:hypothetical protein [Tanacetum cinerariifolium]
MQPLWGLVCHFLYVPEIMETFFVDSLFDNAAYDSKAKVLDVLSKVALTEAEQHKLATKRSKKDFHVSHASGLSDRANTQSKVPNEQEQKNSSTDKGTEDDDEDDADNNDDYSDDNDESDDEKIESDRDEIHDPNLTNVDQTEHEEEDVDERVHTPSDYELTVKTMT